ncbi:hypothetical protein D3C75_658080 [compost metagenome]
MSVLLVRKVIFPLISAPLGAAGSVVAAASPPVLAGAAVAAGSSVAVAALLLVLLEPQPVRDRERIMIITNDNENNLFLIA